MMRQFYAFDFRTKIAGTSDSLPNLFFINDNPTAADTTGLNVVPLRDQGSITLQPQQNHTPTRQHHHFELGFAPGILAKMAISIKESTDWAILVYQHPGNQQDTSNHVSIYFLYIGRAALTIDSANPLSLTLKDFAAASAGGDRSTSVQCVWETDAAYSQIHPAANPGIPHHGSYDPNALTTVDIVNRSRSNSVPLHVGFSSLPTVLDDGSTQNQLTLRIVNLSDIELPLQGDGRPKAKFQLFFDTTDFKLASTSQVGAFTVAGSAFQITGPDADLLWTLTPRDESWPAGQSVELEIGNIVTSEASGQTLLHLDYQDIPGHSDGSFAVPIEKSPLTINGHDVGIQTRQQLGALTVETGTGPSTRGFVHVEGGSQLSTAFDSKLGAMILTATDQPLTFTTNNSFEIPPLTIGSHSENHYIGIKWNRGHYHAPDRPVALCTDALPSFGFSHLGPSNVRLSTYVDGTDGWFGTESNSPLNLYTNGLNPRLTISADGNVGIGTTSPSYKLQVQGNAYIVGHQYGGTFWQQSSSGKFYSGDWGHDRLVARRTPADRGLKQDAAPLASSLDKVLALQGYSYRWDAEKHFGAPADAVEATERMGLIAQDVEQVLPGLVRQETTTVKTQLDDGGFEENVHEYKSVDYSQLHALVVEAIKELKAEKDQEIAALNAQIADLKQQLS